ncbi:MAG: hypothetical protein ACKVVP_13270 [Chloroflexota bacterium]
MKRSQVTSIPASLLPLLSAATAGLLAMLALIQLSRAIVAIMSPIEAMYGEAIIHDQAARLLRGEPLYQPLTSPPYAVAAYTPVYYYLAAALQAVWGAGFGPGRMASFLAGLLVVALVSRLTLQRTGDPAASFFAGLAFLGLGLPGPNPWFGLYKEDVLGVLFSLAAVACLSDGMSQRRCMLAGLLAALAILTKQTHLATMAMVGLWLFRQDRTGGTIYGAIVSILVLGVGVAFELATGAYLANTIFANVNPFQIAALVANLQTLGVYQGVPIVIVAIYIFRGTWNRWDSLLTWFWIGSALQLIGLAKVGSNHNYWMELAAASAVLGTAGIWAALRHFGQCEPRVLSDRAVAGRLLVLAALPVIIGSVGLMRFGLAVPESPELPQLIDVVRSEPLDVLAVPLDVLALSNRPILLEPYLYSILEREGRWDSGPLVERIMRGEIGLVIVDRPLEFAGPHYHGYPHWPDSVLHALRTTMTLDSVLGDHYVYRPAVAHPASLL